MKSKTIVAKPKELELEFGNFKIIGKVKKGNSMFTGEDVIFTIDGKPYHDVIGYCSSMDIHIGTSEEVVTVKLVVYPKSKKVK